VGVSWSQPVLGDADGGPLAGFQSSFQLTQAYTGPLPAPSDFGAFERTQPGAADRIVKASHPDCAKRLGREVRGFDQDRWDEHRFDLVMEGNRAKFSQHPDLQEFLLGTGERVLVEASPVDRIWGAGLAADDDRIADPHSWRGLNLLGFALMTVRDELAETTSPEPGGHTILNTRINDKLPVDALHE